MLEQSIKCPVLNSNIDNTKQTNLFGQVVVNAQKWNN